MKTIIKYLSALALIQAMITLPVAAQKTASDLEHTISNYYMQHPKELMSVHVPREQFFQGDYIFFKAYLHDIGKNLPSELSKDLFVKLYDVYGNEIVEERFPVMSGTSFGYISVPKGIKNGIYTFTVYSGWYKNYSTQRVFTKEILILPYQEDEKSLQISFDNSFYKNGEIINGTINAGVENANLKLKANLVSATGIEAKIKLATNNNGEAIFTFEIPEGKDILGVSVSGKNDNIKLNAFTLVPYYKDVNVDIYVEGGVLLPEIRNTILLKVSGKKGLPIEMSGEIIDSDGNEIQEVKTNSYGMARVSLLVKTGKSYFFKYTNALGKDEKVSLPDYENGRILVQNKGIKEGHLLLQVVNYSKENLSLAFIKNAEVYFASEVGNASHRLVKVPVEKVPGGIAQILLFSDDFSTSASRLVYIPFESTDFPFEAGTLDAEKLVANDVLTSSLALVNNSKSNINHGFNKYYCADYFESNSDVDYIDDKILAGDYDYLTVYLQEKQGVSFAQNGISGYVYDEDSNVVAGAKVQVMNVITMKATDLVSDEKGRFTMIYGKDRIKENILSFSATDGSGDKEYIVVLDRDFENALANSIITTEEEWGYYCMLIYHRIGNEDLVDLGKFNSSDKTNVNTSKNDYLPKYAHYNSVEAIIKSMANVNITDQGCNNGVYFAKIGVNSFVNQMPALIVIDGQKAGTSLTTLQTISPVEVVNISLYTEPVDVQMYTSFNNQGVVVIETNRGKMLNQDEHISDIELDYSKYIIPEEVKKYTEGNLFLWQPVLGLNAEENNIDLNAIEEEVNVSYIMVNSYGESIKMVMPLKDNLKK